MNDANSKQINISGQHNKFQLKRAQREKQRENKQYTFDEKLLLQREQVRCINQIYLDEKISIDSLKQFDSLLNIEEKKVWSIEFISKLILHEL